MQAQDFTARSKAHPEAEQPVQIATTARMAKAGPP